MPNKRNKPAVPELQFNVSQLLKETTGATRHYGIRAQLLDELDDEVKVVSPVEGQVRFLRTGTDILVTGSLTVTVQKACDRCLRTFTRPITIELEEQFYPTIDVTTGAVLPTPSDADDANQITAQHILDLLEVVRQGLQLESGGLRYCRPDCQGLCPHCGQDRNRFACNCEAQEIDQRWADLRAMQIED
jgi:uncharacterized protein